MRRIIQRKHQGFTLLEMLLVSAIVIAMLGLLINYTTQTADEMRRNKTVVDMQQILNAALSYYNQNGKWPSNNGPTALCTNADWDYYNAQDARISVLQQQGYLPKVKMLGAGGYGYYSRISQNGNFIVVNQQGASSQRGAATAEIIAGQLPSGMIGVDDKVQPEQACTISTASTLADCATGNCFAVAQVSPPGQNLNNARSINFAGIYNTGACVPVPVCPQGMTAEIIAVPASASGLDAAGTNTTYPITGFTAYATSPAAMPNTCNTNTPAACPTQTPPLLSGNYWRVCLQLQTVQGNQTLNNSNWAKIAAFTRCAPTGENSGSNLSVWSVD